MMSSTRDDYNPFEDPSVKNLTEQSTTNQDSIGTYNPFDKSKQPIDSSGDHTVQLPDPSATPLPPAAKVIEMQQPFENPPPYEPSGAQAAMSNDLQKRQEELERKANELQEREARLNAAPAGGTVKNWPPLPARCCVGPCFYQDISVEIPDSYQKTVRVMFYLWTFYAFLLLLNMLGSLALFIADGEGTTFGLSIVVFMFFIPLSFLCWFRPLYKAFRADSSFNFMVFFFVFFAQFIIAVFYAVGIPGVGSCGLLNGITTLSKKKEEHVVSVYTVGVIAVFIGFLWAIYAMVSFYMLVKIHRMYRGTTASFAKAQEELASGVMRNPHVQTAATNVAAQAAQQTFNAAATGLRY